MKQTAISIWKIYFLNSEFWIWNTVLVFASQFVFRLWWGLDAIACISSLRLLVVGQQKGKKKPDLPVQQIGLQVLITPFRGEKFEGTFRTKKPKNPSSDSITTTNFLCTRDAKNGIRIFSGFWRQDLFNFLDCRAIWQVKISSLSRWPCHQPQPQSDFRFQRLQNEQLGRKRAEKLKDQWPYQDW